MTNKISDELKAINSILGKVGVLSKVQKETIKVSRSASVTDGLLEGVDFDVVVKCASRDFDNIERRLASIKGIVTEKIADNILGIREKR